jgi:hypothetical protein
LIKGIRQRFVAFVAGRRLAVVGRLVGHRVGRRRLRLARCVPRVAGWAQTMGFEKGSQSVASVVVGDGHRQLGGRSGGYVRWNRGGFVPLEVCAWPRPDLRSLALCDLHALVRRPARAWLRPPRAQPGPRPLPRRGLRGPFWGLG